MKNYKKKLKIKNNKLLNYKNPMIYQKNSYKHVLMMKKVDLRKLYKLNQVQNKK